MSVPMNRVVGGAAIAVLWVLLFGDLSVANLVGGAAVAAAVVLLLPRRGPGSGHRLSPWGVVVLLAGLAVQLVVSSVRVALAVIRPTSARLRTQVVSVPLRTDSELVGTMVADLITLTPGTLALDVRHDPERVVVHSLGDVEAEEVRAVVRRLEGRVLRAVAPASGAENDGGGGAG